MTPGFGPHVAAAWIASVAPAAVPPPPLPPAAAEIEQLAPAKPTPTSQIEAPAKREQAGDVAQLPATARATDGDPAEDALIAGRQSPAQSSAAEVARAFEVIRARGQEPTPELIAREIGPEALQAYLETTQRQSSLPAPKPSEPALPDPGKATPGTTIIPPKG